MKKILALLLMITLMLSMTTAMAADYTFSVHHIASTSHPYQWGAEFFNDPPPDRALINSLVSLMATLARARV